MKIFAMLFFFLASLSVSFCQDGQPADKLLSAALTKAKKENKNVFMVFTATWCGPCKYLKRGLYDVYNVEYFQSNYILLEIHKAEKVAKKYLNNPGADSMLASFGGDTTAIPYWMILNVNGKKLHGELGFSNHPDSLKLFIKTLKTTSKLRDGELRMIYDRFIQLSKLDRFYD